MSTPSSPATVPPGSSGSHRRLIALNDGFTLIEVLVSALMVILIATATARALIASNHFAGDQRFRSQADSVASQDQDRLRGMSDEQLNGLNQSRTVTLNGTNFTVQSTASYLDTTGGSSCSSTAAAYYKIISTVSWTENFSSRPATLSEQAILSRPVSGDLLTQVTDQTGAGLASVTVTPSGPSTQSALTDSNGCVLFAGLTPGSYTVSLADSGYVDPNGNSPATGTASVTATGVARPAGGTFHLGKAGTITANLTASGGTAEADGVSYTGTGASYGMSSPLVAPKTAPASPASSISAGQLFPFYGASAYTNNYTVWGGRCPGQQPPTPTQTTVNPGGTTTQPVAEPLLKLSTVTYNGSAVKPTDVRLTFTDSTGCTDKWWATLVGTPASPPAPANGWLANPGQPYAASGLTVCADYTTGGKTYYVTTAATNTSFSSSNAVATIAIKSTSSTGKCP